MCTCCRSLGAGSLQPDLLAGPGSRLQLLLQVRCLHGLVKAETLRQAALVLTAHAADAFAVEPQ